METTVTPQMDPQVQARLDGWRSAVEQLLGQVEGWCNAFGLPARREPTEITERAFGTYTLPSRHARMPNRVELYVTPIASEVYGGRSRVDVETWPSLNRVRLVSQGDG